MNDAFATQDELNEYRATHKLGRLIDAAHAVTSSWEGLKSDAEIAGYIESLSKAIEEAKK